MVTVQWCNEYDVLLGLSVNEIESVNEEIQTLIGIGFLFFVVYIII